MGVDLILALFALYIVGVSLWMFFQEPEHPRLTAMKKVWGRKPGLVLHFLANVALPFVFALVFMCEGIAGGGVAKALSAASALQVQKGVVFSLLDDARREWERFHFDISALSPLHAFHPEGLATVSIVLLSP